MGASERLPLLKVIAPIALGDSLLQLHHLLEAQQPVLETFDVGLLVLSDLVVEKSILLLIQFQLVINTYQNLLLELVQEDSGIIREGMGERGGLEGLVIPNLGGEENAGDEDSFVVETCELELGSGDELDDVEERENRDLPLHLGGHDYVLDKVGQTVSGGYIIVNFGWVGFLEDVQGVGEPEGD